MGHVIRGLLELIKNRAIKGNYQAVAPDTD